MSRRVTKDDLARNLARARLLLAQLERTQPFTSLYLPFIDSTLRDYYGTKKWDDMLAAELAKSAP